MPHLRIALFVEGSDAQPSRRDTLDPLQRIWNEHLPNLLGFQPFEFVFPISKTHLVALDPRQPAMSGNAEPLDKLVYRLLGTGRAFDAAVVAWDLQPRWDPKAPCCRWTETVDLYRFLAASDCLSVEWVNAARRRLDELESRSAPSARPKVPQLSRGMVLPLCMEPVFEALLTSDESDVRRALGVSGTRLARWPGSWGRQTQRPDQDLLGPSIRAARRVEVRLRRTIRGAFETNKNEWAEYLLRRMLSDPAARSRISSHPITARLRDLMA